MRHVPLSEFQDRMAEFLDAAAAGDEIVVTRDGDAFVHVLAPVQARLERQRDAVERLHALGEDVLRRHGPTSAADLHEMIAEGRR